MFSWKQWEYQVIMSRFVGLVQVVKKSKIFNESSPFGRPWFKLLILSRQAVLQSSVLKKKIFSHSVIFPRLLLELFRWSLSSLYGVIRNLTTLLSLRLITLTLELAPRKFDGLRASRTFIMKAK